MTTTKTRRANVYETVTAQIVEKLEQGIRPWAMPWDRSGGSVSRPLRHNGQPYTGVNVLTLWIAAETAGFSSPYWMTFRQALALEANVRKGEKAAKVMFMRKIEKDEEDEETGEEKRRTFWIAREYSVFNADQIDGLPERYSALPSSLSAPERIERAEQAAAATGAKVQHGGTRAFYRPSNDLVQMPDRERFKDAEAYYGVLFHELTHWTGHKSRLDRLKSFSRFGDDAYAFEELIAEMGAAFACADLGIEPEVRDDHAAYIDHWLKVLKGDSRAIFRAASEATKAADWIMAAASEDDMPLAA